jgi:integrase
MATVRKRGSKYQAQVRIKGFSLQTKTFLTSAAAKAWTRRVEMSMDDGSWIDPRESRSVLIGDILDLYVEDIEKFEAIDKSKAHKIDMVRRYFGHLSVHELEPSHIMDFAAERSKQVKPSTLGKNLYFFKQAVSNAEMLHGLVLVGRPLDNTIKILTQRKIIAQSEERTRRLEGDEWKQLTDEAGTHWIRPMLEIAVESGMRQGEIHSLEWKHIDFDKSLIGIWRKDKRSVGGKKWHIIPMWRGVREALLRVSNETGKGSTVFCVKRSSSISDKFARMCTKLDIVNLRFHDLRHEAITRMFEDRKMSVEQVRLVSGHSSLDQLSRYVNLRPEDLVD